MYISVDSYEEMYLTGKTVEEIASEVEKIRREMNRLKTKMESPAYAYESPSYPPDSTVISIYRTYLERALIKYASFSSYEEILTEAERGALEFNGLVDAIRALTLTVGNYLQYKYELSFNGGDAKICERHVGKAPITRYIEANLAKDLIKNLHIGEWKHAYLPEDYGCTLNEPVKWQLRIDYNNGIAPRFYDGLGIFPYNFDALCQMLGADEF